MKSAPKWIFLLWLATAVSGNAAESCDPIKTFTDGKSPLREIFVSTAGSNRTGDGSRAKPFQTVERAAQEARGGDAIRLLPGEYRGGISVAELAGSESAP